MGVTFLLRLAMDIDDPDKPEFASWRSYQVFEQRVRQVCRYVWDREVHAFLDTVKATLKQREGTIRLTYHGP